jgi:predicted esterase
MKNTATILVCLILLSGSLLGQTNITNQFISRYHTYKGTTLPYRLFIPAGYSRDKHYPIVLCLHGSGSRGSDNVSQITSNRLATSWADPTNQVKYPCFVVAPQCPANGNWYTDISRLPIRPELAVANNILDSLAQEFAIDTNRFYVTGLSMGGYGTWELIIRFPRRFAAAVPMAGGVDQAYANSCMSVPIWDFHGALDSQVPVEYSRFMMDALRALGRPVVYTHCRNLDCTGLSDSTIAMYVQSHADLFYTEYQNGGHTSDVWNESYDYPYLFPWVFDKYKKQPDAITLSNLKSHRVLNGIVPVNWSSMMPGDSVELWFSSDAGTTWQPLARSAPNTGTFLWNTSLTQDCAFGQIQVFLKNSGRFIIGSDRSLFLNIDNHGNGPPFVSLLNDEFTTGMVFDQDSLDLRLLAGDPEGAPLAASVEYSPDGGRTFGQIDSYTALSDTLLQTRRIGIGPLPNSPQAVIELVMSEKNSLSQAKTYPFAKITPRVSGPSVTHTAGKGAATVAVHVLNPSAMTGHRYLITFKDSSAGGKQYAVRDVDRGVDVVQHATQLDGAAEGPLFDGIRLVIKDLAVPYVDTDSTRWLKGSGTLQVEVSIPVFIGRTLVQGVPDPFDYLITLFNTNVDTSKAGFGLDATPMKFIVRNLTTDTKADVIYYDANGNNTIGPSDYICILGPDSLGKLRPSWQLRFVGGSEVTVPVPGDEFLLRTVKGVTAADVYQFTATVTSVSRSASPQAFSLEQNFPNPFNPSTTIRYSLGRAASVKLVVFNLLGQPVATLVEWEQQAGVHVVRFDPRNLASGVYFYRLQAGTFVETKRLLILR